MVVGRKELYRLDSGKIRMALGIALVAWGVANTVVMLTAWFGIIGSVIPWEERFVTCVVSLVGGAAFIVWGWTARRWRRLAREYDGLIGENATPLADIALRRDVPSSEVLDDLVKLSAKHYLPDCHADLDAAVMRRDPPSCS